MSERITLQQSRNGVTLIEMMIASLLLGLAVSGLIIGFTTARRSAVMAADQMNAMNKARQAMETLSDCLYGDAKLALGTSSFPDLGISNSYTVTQNTNYPSTKDVAVNIYWTTLGRTNIQSVTFSSSFTLGLHYD